jgi:hypothetical protein
MASRKIEAVKKEIEKKIGVRIVNDVRIKVHWNSALPWWPQSSVLAVKNEYA